MALRAKIRGTWRNVSPAMARVFRARGVLVEDVRAVERAAQVAGDVVLETGVVPEELSDASPIHDEPEIAETIITFPDTEVSAPRVRRCSLCGESGHTKAKCPLAELDALTSPDGGGSEE